MGYSRPDIVVNYCSLLGATALDPSLDAAAPVGDPPAKQGGSGICVIALSRDRNLPDKNEPCGRLSGRFRRSNPKKNDYTSVSSHA